MHKETATVKLEIETKCVTLYEKMHRIIEFYSQRSSSTRMIAEANTYKVHCCYGEKQTKGWSLLSLVLQVLKDAFCRKPLIFLYLLGYKVRHFQCCCFGFQGATYFQMQCILLLVNQYKWCRNFASRPPVEPRHHWHKVI